MGPLLELAHVPPPDIPSLRRAKCTTQLGVVCRPTLSSSTSQASCKLSKLQVVSGSIEWRDRTAEVGGIRMNGKVR